MDGFAIRTADLALDRARDLTLTVAGEVRIGEAPSPMLAGQAVRIVTGAAIPPGCDAVIKREDLVEDLVEHLAEHVTDHQDGAATHTITISQQKRGALRAGANIRARGENTRAGDELLASGRRLTAASIGALAAVGCALPLLFARVHVAIITTGDEVVAPGETPAPFQIRNSNGPALEAVLAAHPSIEVTRVTHVRDEDDALASELRTALTCCDAIIFTGGISMGHRDGVRTAIESVGADVLFHGLPQRPGKPMLAAVAGGVAIFALPGNPVSTLVTCTRIVLPVLDAMAGLAHQVSVARVAVANPDHKSIDLWWHRLVRITSTGEAHLADGRGSGDMISAGITDGFIEVPPGAGASASSPFYPWST